MMRYAVMAFVLLLVVSACSSEHADVSGVFHKLTYKQALAQAQSAKKVVMIDFYATWCGPCQTLDAETFSDAEVQTFLKNKTVAIRVNIDKNGALAAKHRVTGIPCLLFLSGEGAEIGRIPGFVPAGEFLQEARRFVN